MTVLYIILGYLLSVLLSIGLCKIVYKIDAYTGSGLGVLPLIPLLNIIVGPIGIVIAISRRSDDIVDFISKIIER
jgi:hypothetical protein